MDEATGIDFHNIGSRDRADASDDMPMRSDLPTCDAGPRRGTSTLRSAWAWTVATLKDPEFQLIALFCTVGLWLTFYFTVRFPDFVEMELIFLAQP
jgi:hypothetical protein